MNKKIETDDELRDRIHKTLRKIWEERPGLPPEEMVAIVEFIQTADNLEALYNAVERIVGLQGKKMNHGQKRRFEMAVESQINIIDKKPSPIIPIGAEIKVKNLKGEVVDHSSLQVRIKWEDGTGDWVHGDTAYEHLSE